MSITDGLKDYADSKLHRIENFINYIESIAMDLDIDHYSTDSEQHKASILVHVPGTFLKASETSDSMYASIDLVMDKIYLQLKKYKDKAKSHRDDPKHLINEDKPKRSISIAKNTTKGIRFVKQPMEPEEAADLMEREELPVLVFRNLTDELVNVLYRRGDSHIFELIEVK